MDKLTHESIILWRGLDFLIYTNKPLTNTGRNEVYWADTTRQIMAGPFQTIHEALNNHHSTKTALLTSFIRAQPPVIQPDDPNVIKVDFKTKRRIIQS